MKKILSLVVVLASQTVISNDMNGKRSAEYDNKAERAEGGAKRPRFYFSPIVGIHSSLPQEQQASLPLGQLLAASRFYNVITGQIVDKDGNPTL